MIIIVGGRGFIGRAIIKKLIKSKKDFISVSMDDCDLTTTNLSEYMASISSSKPSIIIHLAAVTPFGKNLHDGFKEAENTKRIDLNIYRTAELWDAKVIYASTLSLYNKFRKGPYFENSELSSCDGSNYLKAKLQGETLFLNSNKNIILRLPTPIGFGVPKTTVAGIFLEKAYKDNVLEIWGSGLREQNYVDIEDIALAFEKALNSKAHGIFNIASPYPTTMKDLAFLIVSIFQKGRIEIIKKHDALRYQKASYNCDKARENFGWIHSISLEDSLYRIKNNYEIN